MPTVKRFEDLDVWIDARALNKKIYAITNHAEFGRDFDLRRQIRRASISIMSNIAEVFERNNNNYFIQFLAIAKGSTGEVRAQLYSALDAGYLQEGEFAALRDEAKALGERIGKFIGYLLGYQMTLGKKKNNTGADGTTNEPDVDYRITIPEETNTPTRTAPTRNTPTRNALN